jgi:four helix bundle protein
MKKDNIIQEKSLRFGVSVITIYKELKERRKDNVISNQLLRAGTSVGANVEEGLGCQSTRDFYFRLTIAYKEARESLYWLKLINESGMLEEKRIRPIMEDCDEILRIIGSILKTLRNKSQNSHNS